MFKNNKGQITGIHYGIIGVISLIIVVGLIIAVSQKSYLQLKNVAVDNTATTANNQSLTWAGNNTAIALDQDRASSLILYNNGSVVNQGANYTFTDNAITILNQSLGGGDNWGLGKGEIVTNALNVTESYKYGSLDRNTTIKSQVGLESVSKLQTTITTVIAVTFIIAILSGVVILIYKKINL